MYRLQLAARGVHPRWMDGGCIVVLGEACAWGVMSMERHSVAVQKASPSALDVFP